MKKNNKREKGAALINVMLIVLLAVAIGLPLLYLVIVNFTFRMFDNNLRSISYKNEIGMDNVYAIIQEVVIDKTATSRDKAKDVVDKQVKAEQDVYKILSDDGGYEGFMEKIEYLNSLNGKSIKNFPDEYDKSVDFNKDGVIVISEISRYIRNLVALRKNYMYEYGLITEEQKNDANFEFTSGFKYMNLDDETGWPDGTINSEAVKTAYNEYFKTYYKESMDGVDEAEDDGSIIDIKSLNELVISKADSEYGMKFAFEEVDKEQYAISSPDDKYTRYLPSNDKTSISVQVDYRGKSESTNKYVDSNVSATFTIGVPEFDSASSINQTTLQISNPLLDKTLVTGKSISVAAGKTLDITGNTTITGEGVETENSVLTVQKDAVVNIKGDLAVNGDITLVGGTNGENTKLIATDNVFCKEIVTTGEYTYTDIDKALYIYDDMEIANNNTIMEIETLKAFNDIQSEDYLSLNASEISQKSSAILFNNFSLENVKFNVNNAYIFGAAFVGDTKYKTGESISVKGNYRAYQIPLADDTDFSMGSIEFGDYSGLALAEKRWDAANSKWVDLSTEEKASYFIKVFGKNLLSFDNLSTIRNNEIKINNMKYSTGIWYNDGSWESSIIDAEDNFAVGSNAAKEYEKYVKYFGYGEGNIYREINDSVPTVIGENGWIDSDKLADAAEVEEYQSINDEDEIVVLVSKNNITLTDDINGNINGKKGIIIAAGDIIINGDITFEGSIICGGNLIVNNNFTLVNNSVAIEKIIDDGISAKEDDEKYLFNMFRDDNSGNLYTYSTIDTKIATINMNELITISDWKKSKFDI